MQTTLIGLLAETFIHPGCGRDTGVVDLPVAREAATDYPFIAGSSLKGALKDWATRQKVQQIDALFGKPDQAGQLLVSDARLLLLPVRSLTGNYKWATCPHLLERLARDLRRSGTAASIDIPHPAGNTCLTAGDGEIFLEERNLKISGAPPQEAIDLLTALMPHQESAERLPGQLAILSDSDFAWFARYGLAVQARNALDQITKTTKSGALWYEEMLPPDTLMYSVISERQPGTIKSLRDLVDSHPYIQAGGNETVGQGWFALKPADGEISHG